VNVATTALAPPGAARTTAGLRALLGEGAWARLPSAVRRRFALHAAAVDYIGTFEQVRASPLGQVMAQLCRLIGTPVVPWTGHDIAATVRVVPDRRGTCWLRQYHWPRRGTCTVRSTKVIDAQGALVEELPGFLCMALDVFERDGALHFVSSQYYFDLPLPLLQRHLRIALPGWLTPGTTHVEHSDERQGWFRFTMRVQHAIFGETFYQTGRFRAAGDAQ
jgi:hypothetical protein